MVSGDTGVGHRRRGEVAQVVDSRLLNACQLPDPLPAMRHVVVVHGSPVGEGEHEVV